MLTCHLLRRKCQLNSPKLRTVSTKHISVKVATNKALTLLKNFSKNSINQYQLLSILRIIVMKLLKKLLSSYASTTDWAQPYLAMAQDLCKEKLRSWSQTPSWCLVKMMACGCSSPISHLSSLMLDLIARWQLFPIWPDTISRWRRKNV